MPHDARAYRLDELARLARATLVGDVGHANRSDYAMALTWPLT